MDGWTATFSSCQFVNKRVLISLRYRATRREAIQHGNPALIQNHEHSRAALPPLNIDRTRCQLSFFLANILRTFLRPLNIRTSIIDNPD